MTQAVQLSKLAKTYSNGVEALRGIDLSVETGDFFALLGPNGAGKSTAIGILSSLVNKSAGEVTVFGYDLDREPEAVKSCIGLVPQEFNFNQFEPVEEILVNQAGFYGIGRRESYRKAQQLLEQLDLWGKRHAQARELSGGMKRRLMIARALVHDPRLLILDEPTAGVDIEIRRTMWDFLQQINAAGTTIILTTHYLEEAESLCRHIAIINHGRIVENARMGDLLRRLHNEVFVLSLANPFEGELDRGQYCFRKIDETTVEAVLSQGQYLDGLFGALAGQGIHVVSMRNKRNRLEQFFLDRVQNGMDYGQAVQ